MKEQHEMEINTEVKDTTSVKGTSKTNSRDLESRENNQREYLETDSWLTIPPNLVDNYKGQGYHLGWLRIYLNGNEDYKSVGKKAKDIAGSFIKKAHAKPKSDLKASGTRKGYPHE